jgi:hypothetical protein
MVATHLDERIGENNHRRGRGGRRDGEEKEIDGYAEQQFKFLLNYYYEK